MKLNKLHFFCKLRSLNYHFSAGIIICIFLTISLIGILYQPLQEVTADITNRFYEGFIPEAEGFIEQLEALFWLLMTMIYCYLLFNCLKLNGLNLTSLWLIFFLILGFVAFGEEISWGQHFLGVEPPEFIRDINKQNELNVHNLNISHLIGLSEDSFLYNRLSNFTRLLNPLFFILCGTLWFLIPVLKLRGLLPNWKLFANMPVPTVKTIAFCGISFVGLQVIDRVFFDVGEIIELAVSLVAFLSALDLLNKREFVKN